MTIIFFSFLEDQCCEYITVQNARKMIIRQISFTTFIRYFLLTTETGSRPGSPSLVLLDNLGNGELLAE